MSLSERMVLSLERSAAQLSASFCSAVSRSVVWPMRGNEENFNVLCGELADKNGRKGP